MRRAEDMDGWIPDAVPAAFADRGVVRLTASGYRLPFEIHVHWTRLADPRNEPS
jgi:hypothetical protein